MDNTILDQPVPVDKKPYWAIASLVLGLAGTIVMFYFSLEMMNHFEALGKRPIGFHPPNDNFNFKGFLFAMIGAYIMSLLTLVISFVKEKSSIPRVIAIVGHLLLMAMSVVRFIGFRI